MKCFHINIRQATFIVLTLIVNNFTITQMAENDMDSPKKVQPEKMHQPNEPIFADKHPGDSILNCPRDLDCKDLSAPCIDCTFNLSCKYGDNVSTICRPKAMVECKGEKEFERHYICRYCYQTDFWEHWCEQKANCNSVASPKAYYIANCTVNNETLCLGHRTFNKKLKCNWTVGYRWTTALLFSITLGGFGADRFYLGHWQEGIGKLFSFGGLGVWTLIDVILISLHYLGPADGSLYI